MPVSLFKKGNNYFYPGNSDTFIITDEEERIPIARIKYIIIK